MKNKDKIILYLDNQMTPPEKQRFEEELKNSPELFYETEKLKRSLKKIKDLNIHRADQTYFVNAVPAFRESLDSHRESLTHRRLIYASSAAVIITLIISLFIIRDAGTVFQENESIAGLNDEQLNNLAGSYNILESENVIASVADSVWEDLIVDEFSFSGEDADSILGSFNGEIIYADYISDEEAILVYNSLVNKEIL
jgi:hypothetical protein